MPIIPWSCASDLNSQEKIRCGNNVKKIYDTARTPYRRVLEEKSINQKEKEMLSS